MGINYLNYYMETNMSNNLPEGWTQDKIDEALDRQHKNKEFCCHQGCGWVIEKCKHRTYEDNNKKDTLNP